MENLLKKSMNTRLINNNHEYDLVCMIHEHDHVLLIQPKGI
jgi:hypothetical protein